MIDGFSGFDGFNGRQLKPPTLDSLSLGCNSVAAYSTGLTAGEGQVAAVEGEGASSNEQTEDPTSQGVTVSMPTTSGWR